MTEYSIIGDGTPVLVMHGGHSNCYEEFGYQHLVDHGCKLITPSRAGYGLSAAGSLDDAVCGYVRLLDHLGLDCVHLIGVSAGGTSAIKLASLFPERIKTLTLQSAVVGRWLTAEHTEYKTAQVIFRPPFEWLTWTILKVFGNASPRLSFKPMFSSLSTLSYDEAKHLIWEEDIEAIRKMNNRQRSGKGFLMDLDNSAAVTESDLKRIKCLTLIQASINDRSVSNAHAYFANLHIPSTTLKFYNTWGHLIWLGEGSTQVGDDVIAFLQAYNERGSLC
ncbi:alpha/beta hydrolase [Domibacillus sp. A3M-37]|nr:alpha/beta hydrolase [Domibacillus sp. A3M-37]MCP3760957.1 alpha/beta hydrolase [Domibacillus sp. A3M-37]